VTMAPMLLRTSVVLLCLVIPLRQGVGGHAAPQAPPAPKGPAPGAAPGAVTYEAYAVRFGILPAFSVANLVAGAERGRTLDIPVMVWLLKGSNGRVVLVDSGFYRQKFLDQWKPRDFRTPAAAVEAAGVKPELVTDIIISHAHWDHVDGVDLFPKATVWIQREEYRYYTGE